MKLKQIMEIIEQQKKSCVVELDVFIDYILSNNLVCDFTNTPSLDYYNEQCTLVAKKKWNWNNKYEYFIFDKEYLKNNS